MRVYNSIIENGDALKCFCDAMKILSQVQMDVCVYTSIATEKLRRALSYLSLDICVTNQKVDYSISQLINPVKIPFATASTMPLVLDLIKI